MPHAGGVILFNLLDFSQIVSFFLVLPPESAKFTDSVKKKYSKLTMKLFETTKIKPLVVLHLVPCFSFMWCFFPFEPVIMLLVHYGHVLKAFRKMVEKNDYHFINGVGVVEKSEKIYLTLQCKVIKTESRI